MSLKDFSPISLCNVIYNIISKTLANRLKWVSDDVISPTQLDFVLRRLITDNVILGFEIIHSTKQNFGKIGATTLKLDMSKA